MINEEMCMKTKPGLIILVQKNQMGRLVHTHSTYVKGLIELLKRLAKENGIYTITPGVISRVRGHKEKLKITITRETIGGYKLIARKGRSAQEVYITTKYDQDELREKIEESSIS